MNLRKSLVIGLTAFALSGSVSLPVYAADAGGNYYHQEVNDHYSWLLRLIWRWTGHVHSQGCGHGGGSSGGPVAEGGNAQVPELDGSAAAISLLLLGSLIALRRETRRA